MVSEKQIERFEISYLAILGQIWFQIGFYLKLKSWIYRNFGLKSIYRHYKSKLKWKLLLEMGTIFKLIEADLFLIKLDSFYKVRIWFCFSNLKPNFYPGLDIFNWSCLWDAVILCKANHNFPLFWQKIFTKYNVLFLKNLEKGFDGFLEYLIYFFE